LLALWLLIEQPRRDVRWEHHGAHFGLVLATGAVNVVLGALVGRAAARRHDARLFLVSIAFVVSAGFLGLHALATPGVILAGKNSGFDVATPTGLFLAAVLAVVSSMSSGRPVADPRVLRLRTPLRVCAAPAEPLRFVPLANRLMRRSRVGNVAVPADGVRTRLDGIGSKAAPAFARVGARHVKEKRMRIAVASDHAGFPLKEEIKALLQSQESEVQDFGTQNEEACDLPDFVYPAALAMGDGRVERGIFVDGVGYGSAMIANKIRGVYAAVCEDPFCAGLARSHSNTNVLCIGGKIIGSALALEIVRTWMTTEFLGDVEKYKRRVDKVYAISDRHLKKLP